MTPPPNAFEAGTQKVIPSVLVYLFSEGKVLMIHRQSSRKERVDFHEGKWNGLGGKCELGESPLEAAQREVREESGLDLSLDLFRPLGVVQFPSFKPKKSEDWIVFIFRVELTGALERTELESLENQFIPEGQLHWIAKDQVAALNLWEGDVHFMSCVIKGKPFMGTIWYENAKVTRHWMSEFSSA